MALGGAIAVCASRRRQLIGDWSRCVLGTGKRQRRRPWGADAVVCAPALSNPHTQHQVGASGEPGPTGRGESRGERGDGGKWGPGGHTLPFRGSGGGDSDRRGLGWLGQRVRRTTASVPGQSRGGRSSSGRKMGCRRGALTPAPSRLKGIREPVIRPGNDRDGADCGGGGTGPPRDRTRFRVLAGKGSLGGPAPPLGPSGGCYVRGEGRGVGGGGAGGLMQPGG